MATTIKRTLCFAITCIALQTGSFAQSAYIKAADEHYTKGDYYSAAQLYEKGLSTDVAKKTEYNPYTNNRVIPVRRVSQIVINVWLIIR